MPTEVDRYSHERGSMPVGVIRFENAVTDTQTVTIGSQVYEFDQAANGVTAGRIQVTGQSDTTAAEVTDALVDAINSNDANGLKAVGIDDNEVLLISKAIGTHTVSVSEAVSGTSNEVEAAVNGGNEYSQFSCAVRVPTSTEVGTENMHFAFPFDPKVVLVQVRATSGGTPIAWDGGTLITNRSGAVPAYVTINNAGTTDWSADHTVHVVALG